MSYLTKIKDPSIYYGKNAQSWYCPNGILTYINILRLFESMLQIWPPWGAFGAVFLVLCYRTVIYCYLHLCSGPMAVFVLKYDLYYDKIHSVMKCLGYIWANTGKKCLFSVCFIGTTKKWWGWSRLPKKIRPPYCTMVHNAGQWCTT